MMLSDARYTAAHCELVALFLNAGLDSKTPAPSAPLKDSVQVDKHQSCPVSDEKLVLPFGLFA